MKKGFHKILSFCFFQANDSLSGGITDGLPRHCGSFEREKTNYGVERDTSDPWFAARNMGSPDDVRHTILETEQDIREYVRRILEKNASIKIFSFQAEKLDTIGVLTRLHFLYVCVIL